MRQTQLASDITSEASPFVSVDVWPRLMVESNNHSSGV